MIYNDEIYIMIITIGQESLKNGLMNLCGLAGKTRMRPQEAQKRNRHLATIRAVIGESYMLITLWHT